VLNCFTILFIKEIGKLACPIWHCGYAPSENVTVCHFINKIKKEVAMSSIHYLKRSHNEAVIKVYVTDSSGDTVDVALSDLAAAGETFDSGTASVTIKEIFWGCKVNKHVDVSRWDGATAHGHYYFVNSGSHEYTGFVDNVYSGRDIRIIGDGPFHVIMKLTKESGYTS